MPPKPATPTVKRSFVHPGLCDVALASDGDSLFTAAPTAIARWCLSTGSKISSLGMGGSLGGSGDWQQGAITAVATSSSMPGHIFTGAPLTPSSLPLTPGCSGRRLGPAVDCRFWAQLSEDASPSPREAASYRQRLFHIIIRWR